MSKGQENLSPLALRFFKMSSITRDTVDRSPFGYSSVARFRP